MDFGALQCKPKNPDCERCIFADSCLAFAQKKVAELPVKINKTKIRKRFFNYLVVFDKQQKTLLNKRLEKDIWQGLFEFPLVETTKETTQRQFLELVGNLPFSAGKIEKYNPQPIVHKLSHQHIHTTFWLVKADKDIENGVTINEIHQYPVSVLTANFIKEFGF